MTPGRTAVPEKVIAKQMPESCSDKIDPRAPAGSRNSLGKKSDCNGRPTTDDSIVEAMDEQGPIKTPPRR